MLVRVPEYNWKYIMNILLNNFRGGFENDELTHKSVPIILWSGGLDSTYAVYDFLKKGYAVDLLLLDIYPEGATVLRQEKATNRILTMFRKLISEGELSGSINRVIWHRITSTSRRGHRSIRALHQVTSAFEAVTLMLKDYNNEIVFSYVEGDRTIPYLDDFRAAWDLLMKIQRLNYSEDKVPFSIPLSFPFVKKSKSDILQELPPEISNAISWCNIPVQYEECGQCDNCTEMIEIMSRLQQECLKPFDQYTELAERLKNMIVSKSVSGD